MNRSGSTLGGLIHRLRRRNGWTLRQMSEEVGIPLSTLAKVEADKLSLTYDKLQQLASRLGMTIAEFLSLGETADPQAAGPVVTARRSVTTAANTVRVQTGKYDYDYLCSDLRDKRMVPILGRIRAHDIKEFDDLPHHRGEEFIYVLEGSIEVHLQFYTSVVLKAGQSIYIDSTMGHAYVAKDCDSALILAICSSEHPGLDGELIDLAQQEPGARAQSVGP